MVAADPAAADPGPAAAGPAGPLALRLYFRAPCLILAAVTLILVCAGETRANIRAPRVIQQHPAQELQGAASGLEVQKESLSIACPSLCEIKARYEISAAEDTTAELRFIAPVTGTLRVTTGQGDALQVVLEPVAKEEKGSIPYDTVSPLYLARFSVHFSKGVNSLEMSYLHKPGAEETGYGYFSDGEMRQEFRYELWPLKEWQLAKTFQLELSVSAPRAHSSWFSRIFSSEDPLRCYFLNEKDVSTIEKAEGVEDEYLIRRSFDANFPNSLLCNLPH